MWDSHKPNEVRGNAGKKDKLQRLPKAEEGLPDRCFLAFSCLRRNYHF